MAAEVGKDKLLEMYRTMQTIRQFEERLRDIFKEGKIPGFVHVSIGEEASATGVCAALTDKDYITSTHRGHGHLIAKGGRISPMMAEIYGKSTGYCKGKGGSMHIADFDIGILGANGIVGAGLPIATGAGLAAQVRGSDEVAVCFFGDGASNEGTFHESLNIASAWKLPVIYVCENNLYGEFTAGSDVTSVKDIADRARGHDMPGVVVNGNDVVEVYETTNQAVERARRGEGPTLIECKTYRWEGHVVGEEAFMGDKSYRPKDEIEEWKKRCPLITFEQRFVPAGVVSQAEIDAVKAEVAGVIDEAVTFAEDSPHAGAGGSPRRHVLSRLSPTPATGSTLFKETHHADCFIYPSHQLSPGRRTQTRPTHLSDGPRRVGRGVWRDRRADRRIRSRAYPQRADFRGRLCRGRGRRGHGRDAADCRD